MKPWWCGCTSVNSLWTPGASPCITSEFFLVHLCTPRNKPALCVVPSGVRVQQCWWLGLTWALGVFLTFFCWEQTRARRTRPWRGWPWRAGESKTGKPLCAFWIMRYWWVLLWISLVKRESGLFIYRSPSPTVWREHWGIWVWRNVVLYLRRGLVNSLLMSARFLSNAQSPLWDADPSVLGQAKGDAASAVLVRRGDAFTFSRSPVCGMGEEPGQLLELLLTPDTLLEVDLRNQEKLWQTLLFIFGIFSLVFQGNEAVWTHCLWIHTAPSPG